MNIVVLDIRGLDIQEVNQGDQTLSWVIDNPNPKQGSSLVITLPMCLDKGETTDISVIYSTNDEQTATSWLSKE
jgi:hypothetical protein